MEHPWNTCIKIQKRKKTIQAFGIPNLSSIFNYKLGKTKRLQNTSLPLALIYPRWTWQNAKKENSLPIVNQRKKQLQKLFFFSSFPPHFTLQVAHFPFFPFTSPFIASFSFFRPSQVTSKAAWEMTVLPVLHVGDWC